MTTDVMETERDRQRKRAEAERYVPGSSDALPFNSVRALQSFTYVIGVLRAATGARLLELGCGTGGHAFCLARAGFRVTGVDISPEAVRQAREKAAADPTLDLSFEVGDMEQLSLDQTFDAVVIFDALHHCERYDRVLQVAHRHLRPGGEFVCVEPNVFHRWSPHARQEVAEHGVTELGFSRRQLTRALRTVGFDQVHHYYPTARAFHPVITRGLGSFLITWLGLLASRIWHAPGFGVVLRAVRGIQG